MRHGELVKRSALVAVLASVAVVVAAGPASGQATPAAGCEDRPSRIDWDGGGGIAYPILSATSGMLASLGGTLVPVPPVISGPLLTDATGQLAIGPVPGGGGPFTIFVQWVIVDPLAAHGVSFSNALQLDWQP